MFGIGLTHRKREKIVLFWICGKDGIFMINFEEELAKFKPSKEVDEVEQILRNQTVSDIADLLAEVMEEKRKN